MQDEARFNLLILILNIVSLVNFCHPPTNPSLIICMLMASVDIPYPIRLKMRTVSIISLIAALIGNLVISEVLGVLALGLALNTAYELDLVEGPSAINNAICLSQILSVWTGQFLQKNSIDKDITLIIFTLPNLFLSHDSDRVQSKRLYLINGFIDKHWEYSAGFILGIYTTSLTSMEKHLKFFFIAFCLLLQSEFFENNETVWAVLSFLRGVLVYNQKVHPSQKFFLAGYLLCRLWLDQYLISYMFIGYLIIGVILYQEYHHKKDKKNQNKDDFRISSGDIQLPFIEQAMHHQNNRNGRNGNWNVIGNGGNGGNIGNT